jgi:hypothetical protein
LFAVNTGCRDAEICKLQWDWEVKVPPLETFVFIVPGSFVKNGDERLIVLNDIAIIRNQATDGWNGISAPSLRAYPAPRPAVGPGLTVQPYGE